MGVAVCSEEGVVLGDEEVDGRSVGLGELEGEVDVIGVTDGLKLGDSLGSGVRIGDGEGDGDSVGLSVGEGIGDAGGVTAPFINAACGTVYLVEFSGAVMF